MRLGKNDPSRASPKSSRGCSCSLGPGKVLDAGGRPVPFAYVCRDDGVGLNRKGALTDGAGKFVISVDGSTATTLLAWRTTPFDERKSWRDLTGVSFEIKRDLVEGRETPFAAVVRNPNGQSMPSPGSGREGQLLLSE